MVAVQEASQTHLEWIGEYNSTLNNIEACSFFEFVKLARKCQLITAGRTVGCCREQV